MRYSLRTLLLVLSWMGLACLAMRAPTAFLAGPISFVTLAAISTSLLVIVYRRGRTRAFAVGFLAFAASYYFLNVVRAGTVLDIGPMLYERIHGVKRDVGQFDTKYWAFLEVFHCTLAIVAGLVGGAIAQILYTDKTQDSAAHAPRPPT
jgi:hypothetical protein